jgi:hypothetical protein
MEMNVLQAILGNKGDFIPKYDLKEDEEDLVHEHTDAQSTNDAVFSQVMGVDKASGISYLKKAPISLTQSVSVAQESAIFKALMFGKDENELKVSEHSKTK